MKTCKSCGQPKPIDLFYRNSSAKSGYNSSCKVCMYAQSQRWAAANRERVNRLQMEGYRRRRDKDPVAYMLRRIGDRCRRNGKEFLLTKDDVKFVEFCPVLGIKLIWTGGGRDAAASLDRIDNSKGYVPGNVEVVSGKANRIKSNATPEELRKVADYYARR